jgi:hypothetical protein
MPKLLADMGFGGKLADELFSRIEVGTAGRLVLVDLSEDGRSTVDRLI